MKGGNITPHIYCNLQLTCNLSKILNAALNATSRGRAWAQAAGRLPGGPVPGPGAGQPDPRSGPPAQRTPGVQAVVCPARQRPPAEREAPPAAHATRLTEGKGTLTHAILHVKVAKDFPVNKCLESHYLSQWWLSLWSIFFYITHWVASQGF